MDGDRGRRTKRRAGHRAATGIGALTRRDRYREAKLNRKIADEYANMSITASRHRRRRHLRAARRHERALVAQHRRPQSALVALAGILTVVLVGALAIGAPKSVALVVGASLFLDWGVIRRRRRRLGRV